MYEAVETSVRTSGPVLSSNKPSLVQITLLTGPPVELHVRENVTTTKSISDVSWNEFLLLMIVATMCVCEREKEREGGGGGGREREREIKRIRFS